MLEINDTKISNVEKLLLPEGEVFDKQRRDVIKCLESVDIQACPGSGKTTALLAKLAILSEELPPRNRKGICVFTHTNIAIDEIKLRLKEQGDILLRYPNYFGTIQSFVDRYLATPAYIALFKKRPYRIDNEIFEEVVERKYQKLSKAAKIWLENKREHMTFLKELRFRIPDMGISKSLYGDLIINNTSGTAYKGIENFKKEIMKDGILCFDDAYSLAHYYIDACPFIKDVFSERFGFLFIDEMQDTDKHQNELIQKLFNDKKVIIQRIGDSNQAIFSSVREENVWKVSEKKLSITGSKRFSNKIASIADKVCITPQSMVGNDTREDIPPVIIIFSDDHIQKVLPTFADIIIKNNLHNRKGKVFKAVGWIGKQHEKYHTIPSYWNEYNKEKQIPKNDFKTLDEYIQCKVTMCIDQEGVNYYRKYILKAIVKCLRILDIRSSNRYYTESMLLKFLKEQHSSCYQKLLIQLVYWCKKLHKSEDIKDDLISFIKGEILTCFAKNDVSSLTDFFSSSSVVNIIPSNCTCSNNIFSYKIEDKEEVNVEVTTVHSVKGETHTATLYLETFYNGYDIARIIKYIEGKHKVPTQKYVKQTLKMAHVAMTRPSHLLCLAVHESNITDTNALKTAGWQIYQI